MLSNTFINKGDFRDNDCHYLGLAICFIIDFIFISSLNENRNYILNTRNKVYNLGIQLYWTRAHVGDQGNEEVDTLAKQVTDKENVEVEFYPTKYQLKKTLNYKYIDKWQSEWDSSNKGRLSWNYIKE